MARYSVFGSSGAANTTAANAGIYKVDNPASTTLGQAIYEWGLGSGSNAADNNYQVQVKRQTTAGTWTAVTPSPIDTQTAAAVSTAARISTVAGSASTVLGQFGFNQRAGYRWVAVPGGEFVNARTASNGIILEWLFAQGTDSFNGTLFYNE